MDLINIRPTPRCVSIDVRRVVPLYKYFDNTPLKQFGANLFVRSIRATKPIFMPAIPVQVVIKGIVISDISNFRYGQQLHEQRFFELKFRQPLVGSPSSFTTGDAASYNDQPITLQFEDVFGKMKTVNGTIVKLEFINVAGQNAEVVVNGIMYQPFGNVSKFSLALFALLLLPVLFTGSLFWYTSQLSDSLVKKEGKISFLEDRIGKGTHKYTIKIAPYRAALYREYHTPVFSTASQNIDALYKTTDGSYEAGKTGQSVDFYISKNDLTRLNNPKEKVDFFYLKSSTQQSVNFDYYYDLLIYATDKTAFYFIWICYMFMEVFCFICAYFYYKMYVLGQQKNSSIIWFACVIVAAIFNVGVLSMML